MFFSLFFKFSPILKFKVSNHSMEPLFKENDEVLVWKWIKIKLSDVVVIKQKDKYLLKRVARIKNNKFYVLGDNKKDSLDSRSFGSIIRQDIIGKVIAKF